MVLPQWLLLGFCLIMPSLALYRWHRTDVAVSWIACVTMLDIFNSQAYMNLSAILLFGVVVLPYLWIHRKSLMNHPGFPWIGATFGLLMILGLFYGFLEPWPDLTHARSIKDQAGMRSILHLGRTFLEWCSMLFLLIELEKSSKETFKAYFRSLFYAGVLLALSAVLERWLQFDFYHFFTGGRELLLSDRPRGFAYEPRGLAQNLACVILALPFVPFGKLKYLALPLFLFIGFGYSFSYSGMLILLSGMILLVVAARALKLTRIGITGTALAGGVVATLSILAVAYTSLPETSKDYIETRFSYLSDQGFAEKLEVFDAASINFLIHNPKHLLLGTGPGLVYLPASEYIVERDKAIWGNHFEALPHMGLVLTLSNMGIIGLILFLAPVILSIRKKRSRPDSLTWIGLVFFGLFFVQIRYFYLFGMAAILCRKQLVEDPIIST